MESAYSAKNTNPFIKANILSKTFFWHMLKYVKKCSKNNLNVTDLFELKTEDSAEHLGKLLESNWNKEVKKAKESGLQPSLLRTLIVSYWWLYFKLNTLLLVIQLMILKPIQSFALYYILSSMSNRDENSDLMMYISSVVLIFASFILVILFHHTIFNSRFVIIRAKTAVSSLIYKKVLKMDPKIFTKKGIGQITNLLTVDIGTFESSIRFLSYLLLTPFQIILFATLLWEYIQVSCLVGIFILIFLSIPTNCVLNKIQSSLRRQQSLQKDSRIKIMSNIVFGIQTIKMFAWEKPFARIIRSMRLKEIRIFQKLLYIQVFARSGRYYALRLCIFLTLVCYVALGNYLEPNLVFTVFQYFNALQFTLVVIVPLAIVSLPNFYISIKRIENFLLLEEKYLDDEELNLESEYAIEMKNLKAKRDSDEFVLKNICLRIPKGCLCAIVGEVGSGKSTLLQIILKELQSVAGQVFINGQISYASQKSWLFNSTIKQNILFCEKYDKNRYENVIKMCSLDKDFQRMPQGDNSLVGERGIILSGGQKARLNLARSVYRNADIYLFDDPLSALDSIVSREIFTNCMQNYLKNKTRILVTHQTQYLRDVDYIIVLKEGEILTKGTYGEISSQLKHLCSKNSAISIENILGEDDMDNLNEQQSLETENNLLKSTSDKRNVIKYPLFQYFTSARKNFSVFFVFVTLILSQCCYSACDYWISYWTQEETLRHHSNHSYYHVYSDEKINSGLYEIVLINNEEQIFFKSDIIIYIYIIIMGSALILLIIRAIYFFSITYTTSETVHEEVIDKILSTPIRFFEQNTSGDILNRFSEDLKTFDETFPDNIYETLQLSLIILGFLAIVVLNYYLNCIIIIIFGVIIISLRKSYILTGKVVDRLKSDLKSKILYHVNATIEGINTIRVCEAETILQKQFEEHQDVLSSAEYITMGTVAVYGLSCDFLAVLFATCILINVILMPDENGNYNASSVGLVLTQSLALQAYLQYSLKISSEVLNNLAGVERIFEYRLLANEENIKKTIPKQPIWNWPSKGLIEFRTLYMKYTPNTPYILQNINITICPGEKIGIVGRTGAGKTSLIKSLFRLSPFEGTVLIDKIDIKTLSLSQLRNSISIIPQDPVLFHDTIRYNLDPFNEHPDTVLWSALKEVELGDKITSLQQLLLEGGSNFSFGERQLFCLARAIIRNNLILILDEATANIDQETDVLIQKTIRKKFKNCTVLTIAHRLNTVIDSDRILVLENGKIVEFDHPHLLLQNPEGYFTQMLMKMGNSSMLMALKETALETFCKKYKAE